MQSTLKALETSLYWQQVVLKQSKDAKQKERCRVAIEKLQKQIEEAQAFVDQLNDDDPRINGYNVEFLGAKSPRSGEDY